MNRTIVSIEVLDEGGKEATIIIKGERNDKTLFEERFSYNDDKEPSLRLHLLKERLLKDGLISKGKYLSTECISKLFDDIADRSKITMSECSYDERG